MSKINSYVLVAVLAVVCLIFIAMMAFLGGNDQVQNFILEHPDEAYIYVQSRAQHLKFLTLRNVSSPETRLMRNVGMMETELSSFLENTVRKTDKILLVPNEQAGISYFAILLGYSLSKSRGGTLRVLVKEDVFKKLTQDNIALMSAAHEEDSYPVTITNSSEEALQLQYDYIIVEQNQFFLQLKGKNQVLDSHLVVIRKESQGDTIKDLFN